MLEQHGEEAFDGAEQGRGESSPGRWWVPSFAMYSSWKRSGRLKSSWMVETCQVRPMASQACTEIFGP